MAAEVLLLLVLWIQSANGQLPSAPSKCTPDIVNSIEWGAGTGSFGVRSSTILGLSCPYGPSCRARLSSASPSRKHNLCAGVCLS
jgi:hypothetical protein